MSENTMSEPLISVIVPVYNVEPYLDRCVESIVNQTYRNLEIILVDDGSPDRCPQMCDAWAERDARIRVIHKENGGAGDARNVGIDVSTGEIISLIDSDDYIAPQMYEFLTDLMDDNVGIAECELVITETDNALLGYAENATILFCNVSEALKYHIQDCYFRQTPPNKLYRRNVVGNVRFPVSKEIDDEYFTYRVIANCQKLVHTNQNLYAYRQHDNSVMHRPFSLSRFHAIDAKCQRLQMIENRFPELLSLALTNLFFSCLYLGQMSLLYLNEAEQKNAFDKLNDTIKTYGLSASARKSIPFKQRIWTILGRYCFRSTCRIRNALGIGK